MDCEVSEARLVDLVYEGRLEEALEIANRLTPEEIHAQLFRRDDRHLTDEGPCDEFLRYWYERIEDPYLRALAAEWFADTYLTELAPVANAEFIGAHWRTESLRTLIQAISEATLGWEVNEWTKTPEAPLSPESAEKWRAIGRILAELDLPPAVPQINPDGSDIPDPGLIHED